LVALYSAISTGGRFSASNPPDGAGPQLSALRSAWATVHSGQRFVAIEDDTDASAAATPVTFVLNFFDELRRRVPTR
jgi:hypothetical protein